MLGPLFFPSLFSCVICYLAINILIEFNPIALRKAKIVFPFFAFLSAIGLRDKHAGSLIFFQAFLAQQNS